MNTMNPQFKKKNRISLIQQLTNKQFLKDCAPFSISLLASPACECANQRTLTHETSQLEVGALPKHTDI